MGREKRRCRRCGGTRLSRTRRQGLFQEYVLPLLGLFPWECGDCRRILLLKTRGRTKDPL
jgi:hypothetical protein